MSKHSTTGSLGESFARTYLTNKGYDIVEQNWRFSRSEIDIIARKKEVLVFVEVKTRSNIRFGSPESFVTQNQETMIADAAAQYMAQVDYGGEFRFDIVGVIVQDQRLISIEHFEDAFFPGL